MDSGTRILCLSSFVSCHVYISGISCGSASLSFGYGSLILCRRRRVGLEFISIFRSGSGFVWFSFGSVLVSGESGSVVLSFACLLFPLYFCPCFCLRFVGASWSLFRLCFLCLLLLSVCPLSSLCMVFRCSAALIFFSFARVFLAGWSDSSLVFVSGRLCCWVPVFSLHESLFNLWKFILFFLQIIHGFCVAFWYFSIKKVLAIRGHF